MIGLKASGQFMKYISDISATTKLAAVIGQPLSHSKSPAIYNHSFQADNVDAVYLAFETSEAETVERIKALQSLDALGINITMPGKYKALECVDRLDQVADYVQAVNTIVKYDDEWIGYNTDGEGYWLSVRNDGVELTNKSIVLFGSGGTTRVILARAAIEGVRQVNIIARNLARPLTIKAVIQRLAADYPQMQVELIDSENGQQVRAALWAADIVVQTTSVGMSPQIEKTILPDSNWLNPNSIVSDVIYQPRETLFLKQAQERGCKIAGGGLKMLVAQGSLNYKLFTGLPLPIASVLEAIDN